METKSKSTVLDGDLPKMTINEHSNSVNLNHHSSPNLKLSLLASYDDLCRHQQSLNLSGQDALIKLKKMLLCFEQIRKKYVSTKNDLQQALDRIKDLEEKNLHLEQEVTDWKTKFSEKSNSFDRVSTELVNLRSKIQELNDGVSDGTECDELVARLNRLRCPDFSPVDDNNGVDHIDKPIYAKIEKASYGTVFYGEDLQSSSTSLGVSSNCTKISEVSNRTTSDNYYFGPKNTKTIELAKNLQISSSPVIKEIKATTDVKHKTPTVVRKCSQFFKSPPVQLMICSLGKHQWQSVIAFSRSNCLQCGKRIPVLATHFNCTECGSKVHDRCIFFAFTKKKLRFNTLRDFIDPQAKPMIPTILSKCCSEIEMRGLSIENIYIMPDSDQLARNLILDSSNSNIQELISNSTINTICSAVTFFFRFLNDLGDPLVPSFIWDDLSKACDSNENWSTFKEILFRLEPANRDTLAYLMIHLQKVIQSGRRNKLSLELIAKIFNTILIQLPESSSGDLFLEIDCNKKQRCKIMEYLLKFPLDFWEDVLNHETPNTTPESKSLESQGKQELNDSQFQSPISYKSFNSSLYCTPSNTDYIPNGTPHGFFRDKLNFKYALVNHG